MNVYLICELLPAVDTSVVFSLFAQRFEIDIRSSREATVMWHPLPVEDAAIGAPSQATLFVGETALTWTLSGRPFAGRPSLARWSNFFRVASVAMELVRTEVAASWRLWSEVWALAETPDPRYALAQYPAPKTPEFLVAYGAGFHAHASVLAWEQENALRLDVSLFRHHLLEASDLHSIEDLFER